jgi:phenylacetate-CoA ligase
VSTDQQTLGFDQPAIRAPLRRRAMLTAAMLIRQPLERRVPFSSPKAIERRQRRRLRKIVAHAHANVPYYRETMRRLGLSPGDITAVGDLAKLPLIEREQLQRDPEYFAVEDRPSEGYLASRSGGSSSTPVTVFVDAGDLFAKLASRGRIRPVARQLTGKRWGVRVFRIHPPMSSGAIFGREYRRNLIRPFDPRMVETEVSMYDGPAQNLAAINEFRPDMVSALGSYLEELFSYATRSGTPFHRPKVAWYGGDAISRGSRQMLTEQLGIEVVSVYQAIESPQIGFECEQHRGYHVNIDLCPVRVVDEHGRELPPGEPGEVVISNLVSRTSVLLNYRLGDVATAIPEPCGCGRTLPLLSYVEGRAHEWMIGADGRRLHSQLLIRSFSLDHEIWGYRVQQQAPGKFHGEAVLAAGADPAAVAARVKERFASIVGPDERVEISFVESLPRTGAGKVRRVTRVSPTGETGSLGRGSRAESASPGS